MRPLREYLRPGDTAVPPSMHLSEALDTMLQARTQHVFIVENRSPVGVITETDILRLFSAGVHIEDPVDRHGRREVIRAGESRPVRHALGLMLNHDIRRIAVVDADGSWVGSVCHEDLLFAFEAELEPSAQTVGDLAVAANRARCLPPDTTLGAALADMQATRHSSVLVVDGDTLAGILTESDVLRLASEQTRHDLPLGALAHHPVRTIAPETRMRDLIRFMREGQLRHAVTRTAGGALHVVSSRDVLHNLTGQYGAFLELRLRDLRATLNDLDTPIVEIARLDGHDVVSWRNRAAESALRIEIDMDAAALLGGPDWLAARARLDESGHAVLEGVVRGERVWKVVLSQRTLGPTRLVKAVLTDTTELTRLTRRLRDQAERARRAEADAIAVCEKVFEHAPTGMALISRDGVVHLANREFARLHGTRIDDVVGRPIRELVAPDRIGNVEQEWSAFWHGEGGAAPPETVDAESQIWTADGREQWVRVRVRRADIHKGGEAFAICTLVDINESRAENLRAAQSRARLADLAEALRRREQHTAAILNQAAAAIVTIGEDGRLVDPNPACCAFFGHSADALRARTPFDLIHPAHHEEARAEYAALAEGRMATVAVERRYLHADGRVLWGRTAVTRIVGDGGRSRGMVAVIHDVTAQKVAERQKHELAEVVDRTAAETCMVDPATMRFVYANKAAQDGFGLDLDTLLQRTIFEVVTHPERALRRRIQALLDGPPGATLFVQTDHVRADGSVYPVQTHVSVAQYGGRPHLLAIAVDATEEVRAQRALLRQNLHFESAQRVAGVGSWELDTRTGDLTWSAEMFRIFGQDPARFHPTRGAFLALFTGPEADRAAAAMDHAVSSGDPIDLRLSTRVGGTTRDVRLHAEPIPGPGGAPVGLLGSCLDITKLAQMERQLRDQTTWLEDAQRIAEIGSWRWDAGSGELQWSRETYRIYGVDPERFTPTFESFFALLEPAEAERISTHMLERTASGGGVDIRHSMQVRGERRLLHQQGELVRDAHGEVVAHIGTVNDITDEVRAAEALQREADRLENAQRVGGVGSWEYDPRGGHVHWSAQAYALFGQDPAAGPLSMEAHMARVPEEDRARLLALLGEAQGPGWTARAEYRYDRGGDLRTFESIAQWSGDGRGLLVGTSRDVTEQRRAAAIIDDQRRRLEQAQRIAHVGSWEWDIPAGTARWSDEMFRILGRDPEAGAPTIEAFREQIHPADHAAVQAAIQRALDGQGSYDAVHRVEVRGETRVVHQHGEVERDERGAPARMLGTCHDITEHKRAESRLAASLMSTILTLSRAFAKRDPYTAAHQQRVADLAVAIGRRMGLAPADLESLRLGALVHDIGKISVPAELLAIPRRLTGIEYTLIQTHSEQGYEILRDVDLPWPLGDLVRLHHERLDGSGYPLGLKGDEIPPLVRILSVADVTEAMASHRPYRAGLGVPAALEELRGGQGTRYDADVVAHTLLLFEQDGYTLPPQ